MELQAGHSTCLVLIRRIRSAATNGYVMFKGSYSNQLSIGLGSLFALGKVSESFAVCHPVKLSETLSKMN